MAKKLLNEAQVRRFMGLAGMQSNLVSNYLKEGGMYYEEEEDMADAEMPPAEMDDEPEMDAPEPPADEPEMDEPGEVDLSKEEVDELADLVQSASAIVDKLQGAAGEEEPAMDEPADEPAMDEPADEPDADEEGEEEPDMLEGVELELSEEEIVAEVARRVAKRIMEAKRAQNKMNEALGRRKVSSRRRK